MGCVDITLPGEAPGDSVAGVGGVGTSKGVSWSHSFLGEESMWMVVNGRTLTLSHGFLTLFSCDPTSILLLCLDHPLLLLKNFLTIIIVILLLRRNIVKRVLWAIKHKWNANGT